MRQNIDIVLGTCTTFLNKNIGEDLLKRNFGQLLEQKMDESFSKCIKYVKRRVLHLSSSIVRCQY